MASPSPPAPKNETLLDVQGLTCPLPVLKANKVLRGLPPGARLTVLATDAASVVDFQAYCRETGHALVSFSESAGVYRYTLRKRDEPAGKGGR
jgi:tRNA 2-thiouridine synthesizing protein A